MNFIAAFLLLAGGGLGFRVQGGGGLAFRVSGIQGLGAITRRGVKAWDIGARLDRLGYRV